jgi:uncharacterized protein (TIGR02588 family)
MARAKKHEQRQRQGGGQTAATGSRTDSPRNENQAIPTLEWVVGGIGFVIIAGVLGFFLYAAVHNDHPHPDVKLSVDAVARLRNGYLVQFTAINEGGLTAQGVTVEGELRSGADVVERSETAIEFLPPGSKKRAGIFFSRDPRQFELKLRPLGYEEP